MSQPKILVNLPEGFFRVPSLVPVWNRLAQIGEIRRTSHNTHAEIMGDLGWADAVLMWSWPPLTGEVLDQVPNLKIAAQIDTNQGPAQDALTRGFPISVSRHGFSPAVAELALGLILSVLRRISDHHAQMRASRETWVDSFPDDIDPLERELSGRPVGIVGYGRIGRRLHELLRPFGGRVFVVDPFAAESDVSANGAKLVDIDTAAAEVDVLVLCAASNESTRHLMGARQIEAMRSNAILVNVARAALVDTEALISRLQKGDLWAAIDVFDQEPLAKDHPLRALPNAYLSPHRGGGIMASVERILGYLIDDLEAHMEGRPRNCALTLGMVASLDA